MAWNPSPKVETAREVARKHKYDQVIIIGISNRRGTMESITYGETKQLCDETRRLGDAAYAAVYKKLEE